MPEEPRISICRSMLGTGEIRIDSRSDDAFFAYDSDEKLLNAHRGRTCFIRVAGYADRFDIGEDLGSAGGLKSLSWVFLDRPKLYVLVSRIGSTHLVTPIYRSSKPFFRTDRDSVAVTSSDAEVGSILEECVRRGGVDVPAWNDFARKLNEAVEEYRKQHPLPDGAPEKVGPSLVH